MTLSRWKMMAVGLGVSLGGLAAIAGQCPKTDSTKGSPTAAAPALDLPVIPASASAPGSAPKVMPPAPPASAPLPELPPLPTGTIPAAPPAAEPEKKPDTPVSSPALPPTPAPTPPTSGVPMRATQVPDGPPLPSEKPTILTTPATDAVKPMAGDLPSGPPAGSIYTKPTPPAIEPPSKVSPLPAPNSSDPLIGSPVVGRQRGRPQDDGEHCPRSEAEPLDLRLPPAARTRLLDDVPAIGAGTARAATRCLPRAARTCPRSTRPCRQ